MGLVFSFFFLAFAGVTDLIQTEVVFIPDLGFPFAPILGGQGGISITLRYLRYHRAAHFSAIAHISISAFFFIFFIDSAVSKYPIL